MTKWLLTLGIVIASATSAHAAIGVALPPEAWLVILAVVVAISLILFVIIGAGRLVSWLSRSGRGTKALVGVLFAAIVASLIASWIYRGALVDEWNWAFTLRPYRVANFDQYVLTAERERALKPLEVFRECAKICPEMVVIPTGRFMMGSPIDEKGRGGDEDDGHGRQHQVTMTRSFAVAKFDVTVGDWFECLLTGGCPPLRRINSSQPNVDDFPVAYVSWYDAQAYVAWLSRMTNKPYRLLTEAEWEYAARAATTTAYYWGESCAWCSQPYKPESIGRFYKPNAFGLHDLAANVAQWVEDCYHPNYDATPTDGSAWIGEGCGKRVIRGSALRARRLAGRDQLDPQSKASDLGFRIARFLIF
jgi:formylglycine-generating enzyme required for sulfatase activity